MSRKPRSDAKLRSLSPEQKTQLTGWLVDDNLSYAECVARIAEDWGLATSVGAVADFYQKECFRFRFRKAKSYADHVKELLAEDPEAFDEATLAAVSQKAFELSIAKDGDVADLSTLVRIIGESHKLQLKRERLEIDRRKLEMLEAKVKATEERKTELQEKVKKAKDGGLSKQTLEDIENAINLL